MNRYQKELLKSSLIEIGFQEVDPSLAISSDGRGKWLTDLGLKGRWFCFHNDRLYSNIRYEFFALTDKYDLSNVLSRGVLDRIYAEQKYVLPCEWRDNLDPCLYYTSEDCSEYPRLCAQESCPFSTPNVNWVCEKAKVSSKLTRVEEQVLFDS